MNVSSCKETPHCKQAQNYLFRSSVRRLASTVPAVLPRTLPHKTQSTVDRMLPVPVHSDQGLQLSFHCICIWRRATIRRGGRFPCPKVACLSLNNDNTDKINVGSTDNHSCSTMIVHKSCRKRMFIAIKAGQSGSVQWSDGTHKM